MIALIVLKSVGLLLVLFGAFLAATVGLMLGQETRAIERGTLPTARCKSIIAILCAGAIALAAGLVALLAA